VIRIDQKEQAIQELSTQIINCKRCDLYKTRNKPLVGDGLANAKILVVGESPGYYEDIKGKAFVGEAGKILDKLLKSINLSRLEIYITNVLKCHPPKNHNPNKQEIDSCIEYLQKQIDIIKPRVIVSLGKFASREIFTMYDLKFTNISELHGQVFRVQTFAGELVVIPLFHPAVACYNSEKFIILEEDFKKLGEFLKRGKKNEI